jgi:prepilin-type N-terminal cleavage/methylation domain-containing protein
MIRRNSAFTLVEVMAVVLILALLAGAAAWSFARPLTRARTSEAIDLITSFDASSRLAARRFGRGVDMQFELSDQALIRREGGQVTYRVNLPPGFAIEQIRTAGRVRDAGEVTVECSRMALSPSYALKLIGPGGLERWLVVAGLSGQVTAARDDADVDAILNLSAAPIARRDAR